MSDDIDLTELRDAMAADGNRCPICHHQVGEGLMHTSCYLKDRHPDLKVAPIPKMAIVDVIDRNFVPKNGCWKP